ncbi:MAG TPA: hypothetical protein EYP54_06840 [Anaerolineales bacterium]|nr:hypothetical protein [Anaerolineales bacterium]
MEISALVSGHAAPFAFASGGVIALLTGYAYVKLGLHFRSDGGVSLTRDIFASLLITTQIYIVIALVAVGNLTPAEINHYKEYALVVAAKPALGQAGFLLIGLGALLSTSASSTFLLLFMAIHLSALRWRRVIHAKVWPLLGFPDGQLLLGDVDGLPLETQPSKRGPDRHVLSGRGER